MPYVFSNGSKSLSNSTPLSYIILLGRGYLLSQEFLNILEASAEFLESFISAISNQPVAGSIIVLQDSFRVSPVYVVTLYGPMLSIWVVFHGVTSCAMSFTGSLPYLVLNF